MCEARRRVRGDIFTGKGGNDAGRKGANTTSAANGSRQGRGHEAHPGMMILASAMRHSVGRPAHGNGGSFIAYGAVATRRWLVYLYYCLNGHAE